MTEYIHAVTGEQYSAAGNLFKEYAVWLGIDLSFQHFDKELEQLKQIYATPFGGIILCKNEMEYIACIAVRKFNNETAELKRMYVKPSSRKSGIGNNLLLQALILAKKCNYKKIRLDTLNNMLPAINLYKKNGFYEILPYYYNPQDTAVFFEKIL